MGYDYRKNQTECADKLQSPPESMNEAPRVDGYHSQWEAILAHPGSGSAAKAEAIEALNSSSDNPLYDCGDVDWQEASKASEPERSVLGWLCPDSMPSEQAEKLAPTQVAPRAQAEPEVEPEPEAAAKTPVELSAWDMLEALDGELLSDDELGKLSGDELEQAKSNNARFQGGWDRKRDLRRLEELDENAIWDAYPDTAGRLLGSGRTREEVLEEYYQALDDSGAAKEAAHEAKARSDADLESEEELASPREEDR